MVFCCLFTLLLSWVWMTNKHELTDDGRKIIIGIIQTVWLILLVLHVVSVL